MMYHLPGLADCRCWVQIGDALHRGISGGQKKRVTTGEIIAGPKRILMMVRIDMKELRLTYKACNMSKRGQLKQ